MSENNQPLGPLHKSSMPHTPRIMANPERFTQIPYTPRVMQTATETRTSTSATRRVQQTLPRTT